MSTKKNFNLTILIFIIITLIPIKAFPRIFGNGSGSGYQCDEEIMYGTLNEIETYVIKAAGDYLQACAGIFMLLNRCEMEPLQESDPAECRDILNRAGSHLEQAMETYRVLIRRAENTPYNEQVLLKLREFDFTAFMKQNGYNGPVFDTVKKLLIPGDITGFYRWIYQRLNRIKLLVEAVYRDLDRDKMPAVTLLWNLNRVCYDTLMAGQFVAIIFKSID